MSCTPSYNYRPVFIPSSQSCHAPSYAEHRSRLFVGGTYFRSIHQGTQYNNISLELISLPTNLRLIVYFNGNEVEFFDFSQGPLAEPQIDPVTGLPIAPIEPLGCVPNGISELRAAVNGINASEYIEMPTRGSDIFDIGGIDALCISTFLMTPLSGGSDGPTDINALATLRTGPERSIIIISTTEAINGSPIDPPPSRKVKQWNGVTWVSYCNYTAGQCPTESCAP